MTTTAASTPPALPAPAGAAVVPGTSAIGTPSALVAPTPPVAPGPAVTGGGAAVDPAQVLALLTTLVALLQQMPGAQGAQLGAASVQGGGGTTPVQPGVSGFGPTTMGGFVALGATPSVPFGGSITSSVGGVLLGGSLGTSTSLSGGSVPTSMPSLGSVIGGGGSFGVPATGASFGTTTFGGFSAISPTPAPTPSTFGTAPTGATTVGGFGLGGTVAGATGGGAAAAPAATPQVDMRRVLGTPRPGDVIDTILRSATANAHASKSEGQYIVIQDANGTQLQAHVHGAWASHPTRLAEGIQRGYVQVHVHEDGTLHLHDVI